MASAERRAHVTWTGTLTQGAGFLDLSSGAAAKLPVTWASRTARSDGKTSPEELIAGAHSSCFAMAFSADLAKAGTPPQRLDVTAVVTFAETAAGYRVASSRLEVRESYPASIRPASRRRPTRPGTAARSLRRCAATWRSASKRPWSRHPGGRRREERRCPAATRPARVPAARVPAGPRLLYAAVTGGV